MFGLQEIIAMNNPVTDPMPATASYYIGEINQACYTALFNAYGNIGTYNGVAMRMKGDTTERDRAMVRSFIAGWKAAKRS